MADETSKVVLSVALRRSTTQRIPNSAAESRETPHRESRISNASSSTISNSNNSRSRLQHDRLDSNASDAELSASRRFFLDAERRESLSETEKKHQRMDAIPLVPLSNLSESARGNGTTEPLNAITLYKLYEREAEKAHFRQLLIQFVYSDLRNAFEACGPKLTCTVELKDGVDELQCPVTFLVIEMIVLADESAFSVPTSLHRHIGAVEKAEEDQDGSVNTPRQLRSTSHENGLHSSSRPSRTSRLVSPAFDSNERERPSGASTTQLNSTNGVQRNLSSERHHHYTNNTMNRNAFSYFSSSSASSSLSSSAAAAASSVTSSVQSLLDRRRVTRSLVLRDALLAYLCGLENISSATPDSRCDDAALSATRDFIGSHYRTTRTSDSSDNFTTMMMMIDWDYTSLDGVTVPSAIASRAAHFQQRDVAPLDPRDLFNFMAQQQQQENQRHRTQEWSANPSGVPLRNYAAPYNSSDSVQQLMHATQLDSFPVHHHQHSRSQKDDKDGNSTMNVSSAPPHRRAADAAEYSVYPTTSSSPSATNRRISDATAAATEPFFPPHFSSSSSTPQPTPQSFLPDRRSTSHIYNNNSSSSITNRSLISTRKMDAGVLYSERPAGLFHERSRAGDENSVVSSRALHSALKAARSVASRGHNDSKMGSENDPSEMHSSRMSENSTNTSTSSSTRSSKMQTRQYLQSLEEELRNRSAIHAASTVMSKIHGKDDGEDQERHVVDGNSKKEVKDSKEDSRMSAPSSRNGNADLSVSSLSLSSALSATVPAPVHAHRDPEVNVKQAIITGDKVAKTQNSEGTTAAANLSSRAAQGGGVCVVRVSLPLTIPSTSTSSSSNSPLSDRFESFLAGKASTAAAFQDIFRTALLGSCPVSAAAKVEISGAKKETRSTAFSSVNPHQYVVEFQVFIPAKHEQASAAALQKYFELGAIQHARNGVCPDWREPIFPLPTWVSVTQRWMTREAESSSSKDHAEESGKHVNAIRGATARTCPFLLDLARIRINGAPVCPEGVLKKCSAGKGSNAVAAAAPASKPSMKQVLIVDPLVGGEQNNTTPIKSRNRKESGAAKATTGKEPISQGTASGSQGDSLAKIVADIVGVAPPFTRKPDTLLEQSQHQQQGRNALQSAANSKQVVDGSDDPLSPNASLTDKQREAAIAAFILQYDALHSTPTSVAKRNTLKSGSKTSVSEIVPESGSHKSRSHPSDSHRDKIRSGTVALEEEEGEGEDMKPFTTIVANGRSVEKGVSPNSVDRQISENSAFNSPPPNKPRRRRSVDTVSAKSVSSDRTPSVLFQSTYVSSPIEGISMGSSFLEKCQHPSGGGGNTSERKGSGSGSSFVANKRAATGRIHGEERSPEVSTNAAMEASKSGEKHPKKKSKTNQGPHIQGFAKSLKVSDRTVATAGASASTPSQADNSLSTVSMSSPLPPLPPVENDVSSLSVSTLSSRSLSSMHDRTRDLLEDLYVDSPAMKQVRETVGGTDDANVNRSTATTTARHESSASTSASSDLKKMSSTALPSTCTTTGAVDSATEEHSQYSASSSALLPPVLQTTIVYVPKTSTTTTTSEGGSKTAEEIEEGGSKGSGGAAASRTTNAQGWGGPPAFDTSATISSLSAWGSEEEEVEEAAPGSPTTKSKGQVLPNVAVTTHQVSSVEKREKNTQRQPVAVEPPPNLRAKSTSTSANNDSVKLHDDDDDDDSNDFGAPQMDPYLVQVKQLFRRHRSVTSSSSRSRPTSHSNSPNTSGSSGAGAGAATGVAGHKRNRNNQQGSSSTERQTSESTKASSSREEEEREGSAPVKVFGDPYEGKKVNSSRIVHSPYAGSEEESERGGASVDRFSPPDRKPTHKSKKEVSRGDGDGDDVDDEDATVEGLLDVSNLRLGSEWDDERNEKVTVPYGSRAHGLAKRDWFIEINAVDSPSRNPIELDDATPSSSLSSSQPSNMKDGAVRREQIVRSESSSDQQKAEKEGVVNSSFGRSPSNSTESAESYSQHVVQTGSENEDEGENATEKSSTIVEPTRIVPLPISKRSSSSASPWIHPSSNEMSTTGSEAFEQHNLLSNPVLPPNVQHDRSATPAGVGSLTEATSTDESSVFRVLVTFSDVCWSHFVPCGADANDALLPPSIPYGDDASENQDGECDTSFGCRVGRWKSGTHAASRSSLSKTQTQVVRESVEACYGALRNAFRQDWVNILTEAFARQSAVPGTKGQTRRWKWNFDVVVPSAPVQPDDVANEMSSEYNGDDGERESNTRKIGASPKDALSVYALIYVSCEREMGAAEDRLGEEDNDYEEAEESVVLDIILDYISRDNSRDTAARRANEQFSFPLTLQCAAALMLASQEAMDPSHWSLVQKDCAPFTPVQTCYAGEPSKTNTYRAKHESESSPRFMMQTSKSIDADHQRKSLSGPHPSHVVFTHSPQAATWVARAVSVAAGALLQSTYTMISPQTSRILRGVIDHQQSYVNGVPVNILID